MILLDYGSALAVMVNQLLKPMLWEGLLLAVIGIMMIVISVVLNKTKPNKSGKGNSFQET